jgi:hypothetical protein
LRARMVEIGKVRSADLSGIFKRQGVAP